MAPRHCCCGGCEIDRDGFNRPDAPTLGAGWDDPDSAWTIDNSEALSVDPGVARFKTPHVIPDESMTVYFTTVDEVEGSGMKYRVCCNMKDTDNYHYVEFERNGANDSVLRLGVVSGGVGTLLAEDDIVGLTSFRRQVIAKISPIEFCGTVSNAVLSFVGARPSIITDGIYSGIEALSAGMRIDDHVFEQHRHTRDECPNCLCLCETEYIPPVLNAHLEGTGRLASLNGDILMYWDRLNGRWISDPAGTVLCTPGQTWRVRFNCPSDENDGSTVILGIDTGCINSDGFGTASRSPSSYTCDPLEWVFGPYTVSNLDFACGCGAPSFDPANTGTYTITVTEAP